MKERFELRSPVGPLANFSGNRIKTRKNHRTQPIRIAGRLVAGISARKNVEYHAA
jgi:hypothetical protein